MQRIALVVAAAVALALAGVALAAGMLTGTFTTRISGAPSAQLNGVWTIKLSAGGKYTIALGKQTLITGTATFNGSKITFGHESGPAACTGAQATGVYGWRLTGKTLRVTRYSDQCQGRRVVLGYPFTRVG